MKALGILLCVLASTLPGAAEDVSTLIVVGEGKVLVPADVVYVSISATSHMIQSSGKIVPPFLQIIMFN